MIIDEKNEIYLFYRTKIGKEPSFFKEDVTVTEKSGFRIVRHGNAQR